MSDLSCLQKDRCNVTDAAPGRFPDFSFERATHSVSLGVVFGLSIFAPMKRKTIALLALGVFTTSVVEAAWDRNRLKPVSEEKKAKVLDSLPDRPLAKPKKQRRVLVFYRCEGFVHGSIAIGNYTIQELGKKTGAYLADLADEYSVFNKKTLAKYDAILFNNTTHLVFQNDDQRDALIDFLKQGKGVAGIHAATDNFYKWKPGARMMGGQFDGHPWNSGGTWSFKLDDPKHVLNRAFNGKGFWLKDEIYQYKPDTFVGANEIRILISLDLSKDQTMGPLKRNDGLRKQYTEGGRYVPVSWLRKFEGGRVFYSSLGHNDSLFWNTGVLKHYLDGLQYALGDLEADATPTSKIKRTPVLAPAKP